MYSASFVLTWKLETAESRSVKDSSKSNSNSLMAASALKHTKLCPTEGARGHVYKYGE